MTCCSFAIVILTNQAWPGKEAKALIDFEAKVPEIALGTHMYSPRLLRAQTLNRGLRDRKSVV